ncbi:hypothetical protein PVAP13_3NG167400 [Panicum virgatum]|uniref:Uncharacterized protein n=1 Tax=Panicum virgatum TaxID=38727 RepID=A0A8T0UGS1_PANVG|nr:hypothetical protein PVAP13_3NG167400 [Panicum virgatum]
MCALVGRARKARRSSAATDISSSRAVVPAASPALSSNHKFYKNIMAMEDRLKELEKKANKHSSQGAVLTDMQERVAALEGKLQDTVEALEKTQHLVEKNVVKLFIDQIDIKEKDKLIADLRKELEEVKKKQ